MPASTHANLYQLRIYAGFIPASQKPTLHHAPTMADCVDLAETHLHTAGKPGTIYICEIWAGTATFPPRYKFKRTFIVQPKPPPVQG